MDEQRKNEIKASLEIIENGLESLLELDDGKNDIVEALEKGIVLNSGEGFFDFEIRLLPQNARDVLGL